MRLFKYFEKITDKKSLIFYVYNLKFFYASCREMYLSNGITKNKGGNKNQYNHLYPSKKLFYATQ
ncbi:MAG: hypothetical protein DRN08_00575 [Thermoplasmata archaeon]|nr:MAG: hypothetical protein DRN08_00575 [Thermoplasmata archaeon]